MLSFRLAYRKCLACALFAVALVAAMLAPAYAHASFNEAATAYPAAQDLGSFDAPIYGSDLPEGSYQVTARTSSRMCIMYTDPANADARGSKEQAIVISSGGALTAVFYISKAYTHMYWGTAEDAALATNEDGTDASAYIAGDPDEGYVPHLFEIPISALNEPMVISFFSGGDKGIENGKWYTREVVFSMSEAEYQGIIAASKEPESPEPESSDETGESTAGESKSSTGNGDEEETTEQENVSGSDDAAQAELTEGNVVAADGDSDGSGSGSDGTGSSSGSDGDGSKDGGRDASAPRDSGDAGKRGVRMHVVGSKIAVDLEGAQGEAPQEVERPLLSPRQILGLTLLGLFVGGLALRVVLFKRAFDGTGRRGRGSSPIQPEGFMIKRSC